MEKLPQRERHKIETEEQTERRKERQRMKQELWKYRDTGTKYHPDKKIIRTKGENEIMREKLEKILVVRKRLQMDERREEDQRKQRLDIIEQMRRNNKRIEEQNRALKKEETRRKGELKKIKHRRIELAKELYKYNEEHERTCEEQKRIIIEEKIKILREWDKKTRMEKIRILKQKYNTDQEREGDSSAKKVQNQIKTLSSESTTTLTEHLETIKFDLPSLQGEKQVMED